MPIHALLVYPACPATFWGFNFALEFSGQKAMFPPLGLLTVAALFPPHYELRVVDMNVSTLQDSDLEWADLVFTSTMTVQQDSLRTVVDRCNRRGVPIVAGGPHPTSLHDEIDGVDHFVLDEVEGILAGFLRDVEQGTAKAVYRAPDRPDVTRTPVPRFDLVDMRDYRSMSLQFSRGCPFNCEFCDITKLFGRVPRTKTPEQVLHEFEVLYRLGWRGEVFLVDDNFIGNKRKVLELLPAVTEWQRARGYPFSLITEASVNLANTDELLDGMATAGFNNVFLGIETPNTEALVKTRKQQNTSKRETNYLLDAVRKIQRKGVRVAAGFIVGLDGEDERVFDAQIDFIRAAGIPLAMVGLLNVPKGTDLHDRMRREGRLLQATDGNQLSLTLDFVPEMDARVLLEGYRRMLATLYGPGLDGYFERCLTMLRNVGFNPRLTRPPLKELLRALATSARRQLLSRQGPAYLKFLANVVRHDPRQLPEAFSLAVLGYHFEMIASQEIAVYDFKEFLAAELRAFETAPPPRGGSGVKPAAAGRRARALLQRAQARYESIHGDFRARLNGPLASFRSAVEAMASPSTRA